MLLFTNRLNLSCLTDTPRSLVRESPRRISHVMPKNEKPAMGSGSALAAPMANNTIKVNG
jgi:hypothetical protein